MGSDSNNISITATTIEGFSGIQAVYQSLPERVRRLLLSAGPIFLADMEFVLTNNPIEKSLLLPRSTHTISGMRIDDKGDLVVCCLVGNFKVNYRVPAPLSKWDVSLANY